MRRFKKAESANVAAKKTEGKTARVNDAKRRPTSPRAQAILPPGLEEYSLPPPSYSTTSQDSGRSTDGGSSARSGDSNLNLEPSPAAAANAGGIGGTGEWTALMAPTSSVQSRMFKTPSIGGNVRHAVNDDSCVRFHCRR